ncbi:MAG: hypothetical protein NZL96_00060 [Patescibacteria group bacterium]|nr:hypothetical protein [Patescibacteria group bacterium]
MAFSDDFQNWQRCTVNNLLFDSVDSPFPIIGDNLLYLFYHRADSAGIGLAKANLPVNCSLSFLDDKIIIE